ncbi:MAG: potassium-transporting ATPase subunit B, partial [Burkholderiales bacterium]
MRTTPIGTLSAPILRRAVRDSFVKLDPRVQWRNPVMFVVLVGSALVTLLWISGSGNEPRAFVLAVALWLWFTLLFANFAESMAEGRGKAQAAALRGTRRDVMAKKLPAPEREAPWSMTAGSSLRKGDLVLVEAGDLI